MIVGLALSSGAVRRPPRGDLRGGRRGAALGVYLFQVIPYVRSDQRPKEAGVGRLRLRVAVALLVLAGAGAAFVSDWFVDALAPAIHQLHVSQAFAGLVIVAIASNAVEHVVGVVLAARRQPDLAIAVVVNSVAQIAAFLFPVLDARVGGDAHVADVRAAAGLHRRPRRDGDPGLAGHRRRRRPPLRGLGADRDLPRPCHHHAVWWSALALPAAAALEPR